MKNTRKSLFYSVISLLLCVALFVGTTLAWFTDSVISGKNQIIAGNLDVELKHYTSDAGNAETVKDATDLFKVNLWEPGVIAYENFVVSNEGTLALKYNLTLNVFDYNTIVVDSVAHNLTEVLKVAIMEVPFTGDRTAAQALDFSYTLDDFTKSGWLEPKGETGSEKTFSVVVYWEPSEDDNIFNINNGKVTSDGEPLFVELGISLVATQKDYEYEEDSFDEKYDENATSHTCVYQVQRSGLWKCEKCGAIIENTNAPYIMIYDASNLSAIPLTTANESALTAVGMTIIKTNDKTTFKYVNTVSAKNVYIRMNGTEDLVINAPNDTVHRYGTAEDIYVVSVAGHSLEENGVVNDIVMLGSGNVNVAATASVNDLSVAKYADAENVKITLNSDNVGTIAVYAEQKDTITVVKNDTQTETTPADMEAANEDVVIIEDQAARVGTTLYPTLAAALEAAEGKGKKEAARVVNTQTLSEEANVPEDTVLKVSAFTQLNVTDDNGINLTGSGELVNVGTILITQATELDPTGIDIGNDATVVNYGGFFDDVHENDTSVPDGGIFNKDGQTIENSGKITNIGTIENSGDINNNQSGDVGNSGKITNNGNAEINNEGTVTNTGDLTNNGKITNDGEDAELNLQNGNTTGSGEIESKNGAQEITEQDNKAARVGSTYFDTLKEAVESTLFVGSTGKTIRLLKNVEESISVNKVENAIIDLNNFTITGTVTLYDLNGITIKNGNVESTSTAFRIGEHQYTTVRWKEDNEDDYYRCYGYHPLAPAQNVVIENVKASAANVFSFTNIEDDYTRDGLQQCYGIYQYKTGYEQWNQYLDGGYWNDEKLHEVFTFSSDKDSVKVVGGNLNYSVTLVKNVKRSDPMSDEKPEGWSIEKTYEMDVLHIQDATSIGYDVGRFMVDGYYTVGSSADSFVVTQEMPNNYVAKVNNTYFCYEGGANDAISFAIFGETVYLKESATQNKVFGIDDTLDLVTEGDNITWNGAKAETNYRVDVVTDEINKNILHYIVVFDAEARLYYSNDTTTAAYKNSKYKDFGTLQEAFTAATAGNVVCLMKDVTMDKKGSYNGTDYGVFTDGKKGIGFDLNGYTFTYTGTGAAYLSSTKAGSSNTATTIMDTSNPSTGKIIATQGYCFGKKNQNTEEVRLISGTFISEKSYAIWSDNCKSMIIYGGTYQGKDYWIAKSNVTLTIKGGTFKPSQDAQTTTGGSCFAKGTMITLANGTKKAIENVTATDTILVWDFFDGKLSTQNIALLVDHGETDYVVTTLNFSDGTVLRLIADHGLFDYDQNKFVYITSENYNDYIGHKFVAENGSGDIKTVTLVSGSAQVEKTNAYSITSAKTSNAFAAGLLTVAPPEEFYNWIKMGDTMKYDTEQFYNDLNKYGTYSYSDFSKYVSYEQYMNFNGAYLKIAVEKGCFGFERIIELINEYKNFMY